MGDPVVRDDSKELIRKLSGTRPRVFDASHVPGHLVIREPQDGFRVDVSKYKPLVITLGAKSAGGFGWGLDADAVKQIAQEKASLFPTAEHVVHVGLFVRDVNETIKVKTALVPDFMLSESPDEILSTYGNAPSENESLNNTLQIVYAMKTGGFMRSRYDGESNPFSHVSDPLPSVSPDVLTR